MKKSALIVWGGWEGHEPEQGAALFAPFLQDVPEALEIMERGMLWASR